MDWIPLWLELGRHPKTLRLRRALDCHVNEAIGVLVQLWSWAVDHAPDGDLTRYTANDIADACMWDGDPEAFRTALTEAGFIDADGTTLHDWSDHTGKHVARWEADRAAAREGGARGNHVRWHIDRNQSDPECPLCIAPESPPRSPNGRPPIAPPIGVASPPNRGAVAKRSLDVDVDLEELEPKTLARTNGGRADGTDGETTRGALGAAPGGSPSPSAPEPPGFAEFYAAFPLHNGRGQAAKAYRAALKVADAETLLDGAVRFAADPNLPADRSKIPYPATWLNGKRWLDDPLPAQLAAVGGRFHRDDPLPPEVS